MTAILAGGMAKAATMVDLPTSATSGVAFGSGPARLPPNAVNDGGQGQSNFEPALVPEPAAWVLAMIGLGLTGAALRRRRGDAGLNP